MNKEIFKRDKAEVQPSQCNVKDLNQLNQLMTVQNFDLLKDKLTQIKEDTDPKVFDCLNSPNMFIGRGFCYQAYEDIVERIITFFRENCTPEWYPNNVVGRPLDVSQYSGSKGNLNLKTELMNAFVSSNVKDNINAKYTALKRHLLENGEGDLFGFGVAKFRKWMNTNDKKHIPPPSAKVAMLSFINNIRNPPNEEEEKYKQGRVRAMCFALLLTEVLVTLQPDDHIYSYIKILGATMIHALTTHTNSSRPLWEHICDVIYPPEQHNEDSELYYYVAACTMGDEDLRFSLQCDYSRPLNSCKRVDAEDSLGIFLNSPNLNLSHSPNPIPGTNVQEEAFLKNDIAESVMKWGGTKVFLE